MPKKQGSLLPVLGLEVDKPSEYISERSSTDNHNVEVDRTTVRKRYGTTGFAESLEEEVMALAEFVREGVYSLVRIGLTKFQKYNSGTGVWDNKTGTALTGTSANVISSTVVLISGLKTLVFTNGKDNIRKYDTTGNTADLGGSPPKAKFLVYYKNFLVLANLNQSGTDYGMRVQWPDVGAPETWIGGSAGAKDLTEDGEDITGCSILGSYLTIHKPNCIYVGNLVPTSAVLFFDRKSTGVGTICNNTIQELPNGEQVFLAKDGLHVFNGISAPLIDCPMNEEIRDNLNLQYIHKCWSIVIKEKGEYWVGIPMGTQTTPSTVYKYDYIRKTIHKDTRTNITAVTQYTRITQPDWDDLQYNWDDQTWNWNDQEMLANSKAIAFGDNTGWVTASSVIVHNENLSILFADWASKDFESEEKGRLCRWSKMELWARGNSIKVEYSIDSGLTWYALDEHALTPEYPSDTDPIYYYFDVVSSKIRFRFYDDTIDGYFEIKQFIVYYTDREVRE